ncbi:MAG: hypothetical protein ACLQME_24880 [Alphaproteobacteria bacterium]
MKESVGSTTVQTSRWFTPTIKDGRELQYGGGRSAIHRKASGSVCGKQPDKHDLNSLSPSNRITLYIDADACPVKQEVYRVAERHALKGTALKVLVVSNTPIAVPRNGRTDDGVKGSGEHQFEN